MSEWIHLLAAVKWCCEWKVGIFQKNWNKGQTSNFFENNNNGFSDGNNRDGSNNDEYIVDGSSDSSVDPEEKFSRYVANGYTSIDSEDEPNNANPTFNCHQGNSLIKNDPKSSTSQPKQFNLDDDIAPYSTSCTKCMKVPSPCPYEQYPEVVAALANSKYPICQNKIDI